MIHASTTSVIAPDSSVWLRSWHGDLSASSSGFASAGVQYIGTTIAVEDQVSVEFDAQDLLMHSTKTTLSFYVNGHSYDNKVDIFELDIFGHEGDGVGDLDDWYAGSLLLSSTEYNHHTMRVPHKVEIDVSDYITNAVNHGWSNIGFNFRSPHPTDHYFGDYNNFLFFESSRIRLTQTVPIPAGLWLFGPGLLVLISTARRK